MGFLQDARAVWRTLVIILTPIILIPLVLPGSSQESKCSYVLAVMAVYWITESLPLAVTALIPVLLLPLLGIMASKAVCTIYFKDVIFLLLGGLIVAIAIEESNLHKRFALRLLLLLGVQPRKLLLGFMLSTGFLSMWITNTATTAMMTPIARALLSRLFKAKKQHRHEARLLKRKEAGLSWPAETEDDKIVVDMEKADYRELITVDPNGVSQPPSSDTEVHKNKAPHSQSKPPPAKDTTVTDNDDDISDDDEEDDDDIDLNVDGLDTKSANLVKALCLSVCYSANIGGTGTLTGTGPNIVFKNYVESLSEGEEQISFVSWMAFGAPVAVLNLLITWIWLQLFFFGVKNTLLCRRTTAIEEDQALEAFLKKEHRKLGNMKFAEKVVLGHFLTLVLLWLTRTPGIFTGWSVLFKKGFVSDSIPAIIVALSLFIFPRECPRIFCCRGDKDTEPYKSSPSIMQWGPLARKFPWGVLLLLGGGFALAEATKVSGLSNMTADQPMVIGHVIPNTVSGLSNMIADQLMVIGQLPVWAACMVVVVVTSVTTEIISNTVVATLLLPILATVAASMNIHPIYFMLPATVASSYAFMLPVATPPNAIVFAHGDIHVLDMMKTGFVLNIIGITVVVIAINTFGYVLFGLGAAPDWALALLAATPTSDLNVTSLLLNQSLEAVTAGLGLVYNVTSV